MLHMEYLAKLIKISYKGKDHEESYRKQVDAIEMEFKVALAAEYLAGFSTEVTDKVWGMALNGGHSIGYWKVEAVYAELAELACFVFNYTLHEVEL